MQAGVFTTWAPVIGYISDPMRLKSEGGITDWSQAGCALATHNILGATSLILTKRRWAMYHANALQNLQNYDFQSTTTYTNKLQEQWRYSKHCVWEPLGHPAENLVLKVLKLKVKILNEVHYFINLYTNHKNACSLFLITVATFTCTENYVLNPATITQSSSYSGNEKPG